MRTRKSQEQNIFQRGAEQQEQGSRINQNPNEQNAIYLLPSIKQKAGQLYSQESNNTQLQEKSKSHFKEVQLYILKNAQLFDKIGKLEEIVQQINLRNQQMPDQQTENKAHDQFQHNMKMKQKQIENQTKFTNREVKIQQSNHIQRSSLEVDSEKVRKWIQKKQRQEKIKQSGKDLQKMYEKSINQQAINLCNIKNSESNTTQKRNILKKQVFEDIQKQDLIQELKKLRIRVQLLESENKSLTKETLINHKNSLNLQSQRISKNSFSLNSDGPRFGKIVKTSQIMKQVKRQFIENDQNSQETQQERFNNKHKNELENSHEDSDEKMISQIRMKNDQLPEIDSFGPQLPQNFQHQTVNQQNQQLQDTTNNNKIEDQQSDLPRGMHRIHQSKSSRKLNYNPNAQDVFIRSSNKKSENQINLFTNLNSDLLTPRDTIINRSVKSKASSRKNIRIKTPSKVKSKGLLSAHHPTPGLFDAQKLHTLQFNPQSQKILIFDSKEELKLSEENFHDNIQVFSFKQSPESMEPPNLPNSPTPNQSEQSLFQLAKTTFQIFGKKVEKTSNLMIKKFNNCVLFNLDLDNNILWHFDNSKFFYGGWKPSKNGDNDKAGQGLQLIPERYFYMGLFKDGKKHGFGAMKTYGNHRYLYTGNWSDGVKSGNGKQIEFTSGAIYQGQWKQNKKHGNGRLTISQDQVHEGVYSNGYKNGRGKQCFKNGDFFQGQYKNGKFQGKGVYSWANGSCYQGQFKAGMRSGYGVWRSSSQYPFDQYEGQYLNDKKHGRGTYRWPNGSVYDGQFQNDLKHGQGYVRYQNGKEVKLLWKKGQAVKKLDLENSPIHFRQFQRSGGAGNLKDSNLREIQQIPFHVTPTKKQRNLSYNHQLLERPNRISPKDKDQLEMSRKVQPNINKKLSKTKSHNHQRNITKQHAQPPKFFERHHQKSHRENRNRNPIQQCYGSANNPQIFRSSSNTHFNIHQQTIKKFNSNNKAAFKSKQLIPNMMFQSRTKKGNHNNYSGNQNLLPADRLSKGMRTTENFKNF